MPWLVQKNERRPNWVDHAFLASPPNSCGQYRSLLYIQVGSSTSIVTANKFVEQQQDLMFCILAAASVVE